MKSTIDLSAKTYAGIKKEIKYCVERGFIFLNAIVFCRKTDSFKTSGWREVSPERNKK